MRHASAAWRMIECYTLRINTDSKGLKMSKAKEIINAIPCRAGTRKHKEILAHILTAISGGKVYFNLYWKRSKGYSNLVKTPHAYDAFRSLIDARLIVICDNDAPRHGATGDYFTVNKLHGNVINAIKKYIDNLSETC